MVSALQRRQPLGSPRALVVPMAPRLRSVAAVAEEEWQSPFSMARVPTDGVGIAAWVIPLPPLHARCSPGAAIVFDCCLCQGGGDMSPFVRSVQCLVLYTLSVTEAWGGRVVGGGEGVLCGVDG